MNGCDRGRGDIKLSRPEIEMRAYLGIFVGGLLPLLGHGLGLGLAEEVDNVEDTDRGENELAHLEEDLPALTLGGLGTGAVGTEGNPVSCRARRNDISKPKRERIDDRVGF